MRKVSLLVFAGLTLAAYPAESQKAECPSDMVVARPGVCIDRYEWPNKKGERPLLAQSAVQEHDGPITNAEDRCAYHGKRTCTRRDWVAACQGPDGFKYPYGQKYKAGACNTDKQWRDVNATKVMKRDAKELARLDQSEASGSMEECVSPSGAADMIGNAEEWVRCDAGQEDYRGLGVRWCLVGGYWADPRSTCSYVITKHVPEWHYYETGFRCCLDMEKR